MANGTKSRLRDWKEIAAFFDRDERTVRRWERQRGLPVHRISGGARNLVYAYPDELEAWLRGSGSEMAPALASTPAPSAPLGTTLLPRGIGMVPRAAFVGLALLIAATFAALVWRSVGNPAYAPKPEAQTLFLDGVYNLDTRQPAALERAIDLLTKATTIDPGYADAYARLAEAYAVISQYTSRPPGESYPKAIQAAERALDLDPQNADAMAAMAFSRFHWIRDTQGALVLFDKAIRAGPDKALIRHWYALTLMITGDVDRALEHITRAQELNPQSRPLLANKALITYYAGKTSDALATLEGLRETDPKLRSPQEYLATIYLAEHRPSDFIHEFKAAAVTGGSPARQTIAAAAEAGLAAGGERGMLESMLAEQERQFAAGKEVAFKVAGTAAMLGRGEDALKWLEIALDRREPETGGIWIEPPFHGLRGDARYRALVERTGIRTAEKPSG